MITIVMIGLLLAYDYDDDSVGDQGSDSGASYNSANLDELIKKMIQMVKRVVKWIKKLFTHKDKETAPCKEVNFQEWDDDMGWFDEQAQRAMKQNKANRPTMKQKKKENNTSLGLSHDFRFSGPNSLTVILNTKSKVINQVTWYDSEKHRNMSLIIDNDSACIESIIEVAKIKVSVIPTHGLMSKSLDQLEQYRQINPMVATTCKTMIMKPPSVVNSNEKATIMTITADTKKYKVGLISGCYCMTVQIKKKNGKVALSTIGIIVTIEEEDKCIWSGSLITVDKNVFVVSSAHETENNIVSLVAWSMDDHEYTASVI
jgi:hypothetical protein